MEREAEYVLAQPATRLVAKVIDSVALVLPAILAASTLDLQGRGVVHVGLALAMLPLGINAFLLSRDGQTIGKLATGIRIVRRDGSRAGLGRILAYRTMPLLFLSAVPGVGGFIGLADALMVFSENNQCLHDRLADTVVVGASYRWSTGPQPAEF